MAFVLALLQPWQAHGGEPTVQLSTTINEFVTILINTPVSELRATGLPERALKLIHSRFDFVEMTQRALGSHWKSLEPAEQRDFVDGLTYRLLMTYGRTVRTNGDEKIQYKREALEGKFASIETKVIGSSSETAIDYQLHDVNGQWKVYDMMIEQVSLVKNFRAQLAQGAGREDEAAQSISPGDLLFTSHFWTKLHSNALAASGGASSFSSERISSIATCRPAVLAAPVFDQLEAAIS
jgi:phospholipid transport system substrate-binding protein